MAVSNLRILPAAFLTYARTYIRQYVLTDTPKRMLDVDIDGGIEVEDFASTILYNLTNINTQIRTYVFTYLSTRTYVHTYLRAHVQGCST